MKQRRTVNAMGADSLLEEINYFLFTVVANKAPIRTQFLENGTEIGNGVGSLCLMM